MIWYGEFQIVLTEIEKQFLKHNSYGYVQKTYPDIGHNNFLQNIDFTPIYTY